MTVLIRLDFSYSGCFAWYAELNVTLPTYKRESERWSEPPFHDQRAREAFGYQNRQNEFLIFV